MSELVRTESCSMFNVRCSKFKARTGFVREASSSPMVVMQFAGRWFQPRAVRIHTFNCIIGRASENKHYITLLQWRMQSTTLIKYIYVGRHMPERKKSVATPSEHSIRYNNLFRVALKVPHCTGPNFPLLFDQLSPTNCFNSLVNSTVHRWQDLV